LAVYLLWLGTVNLRRRPLVVTGTIDVAGLAAAVSGLVVVGPMNLFLPEAAGRRFGPLAWPLLLAFYGLCIVLYVLVARPRLVIFNVPPEQLRQMLEGLARRLDSDARLAGDAVQLPQLGVQLHLEAAMAMRNVSLVAMGDRQSHSGWKRLERELRVSLATVEVTPNPRGFTLLAVGLLLAGWPLVELVQTPSHAVAQQLRDMLRM
jgi:hypothetical protein